MHLGKPAPHLRRRKRPPHRFELLKRREPIPENQLPPPLPIQDPFPHRVPPVSLHSARHLRQLSSICSACLPWTSSHNEVVHAPPVFTHLIRRGVGRGSNTPLRSVVGGRGGEGGGGRGRGKGFFFVSLQGSVRQHHPRPPLQAAQSCVTALHDVVSSGPTHSTSFGLN